MAEQIRPLPNETKPSPLELSVASIGGADTSIFDSLEVKGLRRAGEGTQRINKYSRSWHRHHT